MLVTVVLALVVTIAALVTVFLLRSRQENSPSANAEGEAPDAPSVSGSSPAGDCPESRCVVLVSVDVDGSTVELLADQDGRSGRVRVDWGTDTATVLESTIATMGAKVGGDSLRCVEGAISVCLVRGSLEDGTVGEVVVARGGTWRPADRPYFSNAGTIALDDVSGDEVPEVVVVRHDCAVSDPEASCKVAPVVAAVYEVGGAELGCTGHYTSPSDIRGWPDVRVSEGELRPCP
ncbi:hypothetical protein SAMN05216266_108272 [Amycolatopsis marina]|uniref:Uncharacterized protein n=1 Tax=Amycolatopsis marina TaxID=490629 RepID=A0A1I1ACC1_9PSEU|nr:hypothetical protein SAMN05216266_108272 [Amycolatopsis marina]